MGINEGAPRHALRRTTARALATVCVTGSLLALTTPLARADDDYPWANQGQCPIVPQEPVVEPTPAPTPTPTPAPGIPGSKPGTTAAPEPQATEPPPPPPVLDPVTGHLYDPRGPRPTCARRVWAIDGSIGDPWGFVLRNCTSFVAWRLQERNRLDGFGNHFGGRHWGNAANWDDAARALGFRVDGVPAIGAVAQTDAGRVGHVAWVTAIGPGTVTVEEYNHALPGGYGSRTVPVGDFRYLHLRDVAPSPLVGSDRPVVAVADGLGESWTARVDAGGTLRVARPGRPARVVGRPGSFSALAAPALVLDGRSRPWLAATTSSGRVLAGALRGPRFALRDVGAAATTSSPALALSRTGRPVLAATSGDGTLSTRRLTQRGRWSRPDRVGRAGSWATHVAPVLGHDRSGRTWLVAVTAGGATYAEGLERGRLHRLAGPRASITSTPALSLTAAGAAYLHQVTADGRLTVRSLRAGRWSRPRALDGSWSVYASPAAGVAGDSLVVAVADARGTVRVRPGLPGQRVRVRVRPLPGGDPTRSPAFVTRSNAGVFVVSGDGPRTGRAGLLTRPAAALVRDSSPTRAGFTP